MQISKLNLNSFPHEISEWLSTRALFSLEFIVLFLFKVYINNSWIKDTLPASKMELFLTKAIGDQSH